MSDYRDTAEKRKICGRTFGLSARGEKCLRCGTKIVRKKIAGRSAIFVQVPETDV